MTPESGDFSFENEREKCRFFLRRSADQRDAVAVIHWNERLEERASARVIFEISIVSMK